MTCAAERSSATCSLPARAKHGEGEIGRLADDAADSVEPLPSRHQVVGSILPDGALLSALEPEGRLVAPRGSPGIESTPGHGDGKTGWAHSPHSEGSAFVLPVAAEPSIALIVGGKGRQAKSGGGPPGDPPFPIPHSAFLVKFRKCRSSAPSMAAAVVAQHGSGLPGHGARIASGAAAARGARKLRGEPNHC